MYLGIDLGTSEIKAMLVDGNDKPLASSAVKQTISRPYPLWSEQSPENWWQATCEALDQLRILAPQAFAAVRAIGISGQMHGAVLLDARRRVLRPAILWNDSRAFAECIELEALVPESRQITGNLAMPGFTAPKLLWLQKHEPAVFRSLFKVLLPKDYLVFRLTGELVSDMSDAAGTLWLDVARRDWSERMLAATGLRREQMPALIEGCEVAGQLKEDLGRQWGFKGPVLVAGGAGDNAASAVGVGAVSPGSALVSLGSSGVIFVSNDHFSPNPAQAVHAFCHALPQRWCQMSVTLAATTSLSWATRLTGHGSEAAFARLAEDAVIETAPVFLPYLNGERTPHNNAQATGMFHGLTSHTDAAAIAYSVMEGVAFSLADGYAALGAAGTRINQAAFVGGGARSRFWGELVASSCGFALQRPVGGDLGGAFGAARLARMAATGEAAEAVCGSLPGDELILPSAKLAARLKPRYERYQRLYQATNEAALR
ncbi:xylulokinase [Collimonas sp.]|jgi:xylulokinase|uniref:xylulokinase n=1 Tax=Collimonas sp. TaxID=1963772 RepID=UPI002BA2662D|nr:xylulokinase [Collimonas sp.]HWX03888.1 xylulokinase [Collimonas sp.]